jgi:carbamoylphosphate synthase large subunit
MADPVARRYCCDIAEALGLDSLHDVDLMTEPGGAVRLLEVNLRPSGSLAASLAAGAPLLDAAISQALGHDLAAPVPERDVTILRIPMALAAYDAQGEGVNCSAS